MLKDRNALVTGATSGFGRATALALARNGANIIIAGRRKERLSSLQEEIVSLGGTSHILPSACAGASLGNVMYLFVHSFPRTPSLCAFLAAASFDRGLIPISFQEMSL